MARWRVHAVVISTLDKGEILYVDKRAPRGEPISKEEHVSG